MSTVAVVSLNPLKYNRSLINESRSCTQATTVLEILQKDYTRFDWGADCKQRIKLHNQKAGTVYFHHKLSMTIIFYDNYKPVGGCHYNLHIFFFFLVCMFQIDSSGFVLHIHIIQ